MAHRENPVRSGRLVPAGAWICVLAGIAACAGPAPRLPALPLLDNPLIGAWSRDPAGCARPELTFRRDRLDIDTDADGAPVKFSYAAIRYRFGDGGIAVALDGSHPYAKTADRHVLEFRLDRHGVLALVRAHAADTNFIRCSN